MLAFKERLPPGPQSQGLGARSVATWSAREVGIFTLCIKCLRREVMERDQSKCG